MQTAKVAAIMPKTKGRPLKDVLFEGIMIASG
jgi:hypothetical protein